MNSESYYRRQNLIYRLQEQLEGHTDKFWARFVKIAKEVYGELYKDIHLASSGSDDYNGLYEHVTFDTIAHHPGGKPTTAQLQGREHFRSNTYGYYYEIPETLFWSDDDALIRSYVEMKFNEHKAAIVKRAELELSRKRQEFEKLKQELHITT